MRGRDGRGAGSERRGGKRGGGVNGDGVGYLKVVGNISIKCTQPEINATSPPGRLSFSSGFYLNVPFPVMLLKESMRFPAGIQSCPIRKNEDCLKSNTDFMDFQGYSSPVDKSGPMPPEPQQPTENAFGPMPTPDRLSNAIFPSKTGWSGPGKIILSERFCPHRFGPLAWADS